MISVRHLTVTLVVSTALYVLCVWDRQPLPLLLYSGVPLLIVLGSGGVYFPRARYLLPGFPLLLPVALHLSRASRRHLTLTIGTAVPGAGYCGAYMVPVWPSAP